MLKVSLLTLSVTGLCSSPHLHGAFWNLSAHCFGFCGPQMYCFGSLSRFSYSNVFVLRSRSPFLMMNIMDNEYVSVVFTAYFRCPQVAKQSVLAGLIMTKFLLLAVTTCTMFKYKIWVQTYTALRLKNWNSYCNRWYTRDSSFFNNYLFLHLSQLGEKNVRREYSP